MPIVQPREIANLIQEQLGSGCTVTVTHESGSSFDLCIEVADRAHVRSVVGESFVALDASVARRIAASIPR